MAHIDAGKTTTTERILYHSGKIHKMGEVHEGKAQMDFMDQEQERGITIQSAATTVYWQGHQINIIDTPGHVDFTAEVERSLRVLDGGIVVLDGKKGVEAQTETVWRQAKKYKIPRLIFINKMDGVDNVEKFDENLKSIREKLHTIPLPVQFPIGAGRELEGVVDIIEQKAYYCQMGDKEEKYQIKDIPTNLLEKAKQYRRELIEKIIEHDEKLALKYLEGEQLSVEEIKKLLRQATLTGKHFPVFCGSAYKYVGVKLVLNGVVDYLPSPLDMAEIPVFSLRDKNKAGKILANSYIYNVNQDKKERISQLVRVHANDKEKIKEVGAGDIAAAINLEHTITDKETGQMIIAGMGELHLEVSMERLRREYKLDIESKPPKTGGRGHDARIWITFEPNKGKGFEFVDAKKGQDMSSKDAEEVKEGLEEAMSSGLLLNYPLLDVKATLLGGKRHEVDTQPGDFKNAAVLAFRENKEKLGLVLLEPIMQLQVIVPKDYMGDILANLGSRRATIENTKEEEDNTYIDGKIPLKEILNYSTILRQLTKGRGTYSMHLSHYQEVPKETLEKILKEEKILLGE
ncbi:4492_t:CDS:2 [Paraglomus occultum]|uniref:Elongation factor 2 n=1 Tax=Paraglomus occultum TaxID=144539 RepID=A0A9N9FMB8_9GLOM|nr:4492_t:CDS:2 [Paraglomus occultum]